MRLAFSFVSALLLVGSWVPFASALGRQHHLGAETELAMLRIDDKSTASVGAGLALHYTYGLNDQFNLMGEAGRALVARNQEQDGDSPRTRPASVDRLTFGVGYVLDVLRWVPYFGLLGGAYRLSGGTLNDALVLPGAEVAVGLDYLCSHRWTVGLAGRQHSFFTKLGTYPSYTTLGLRLEYVWGF